MLQGSQEFQRFVDRSQLRNLDKRVRSSSPIDQLFLVPVLCAHDKKNCSIALSHGPLPPKRIVVSRLALALGLAACQKGYRVRFTTAAALVHELLEARDDKRLLRLQKQLAKQDLLIVDELGYVPLSKTGSELLFEIFSQRYERASTLVTSNLPFNEWTEIFGSERLTGALLDRLTHHVHILEMNGESYRLQHSKRTRKRPSSA